MHTATTAPVKVISLLVATAAGAVVLGWVLDIGILKSLTPASSSMKFSTAIAFVLSGITLYFLARARDGEFEKAQVALSITSLALALLMGSLFFSNVFGIETGIENLFVRDAGDAKSVVPGRPSVPTMVGFLMVALAAIVVILSPAKFPRILRAIGSGIVGLGSVAVVGYICNVPILYYYVAGIDTAMALHTALLFVPLGVGLILL